MRHWIGVLLLGVAAASPAAAADVADGKLVVGGFGGLGVGVTDGNDYLVGTEDGSRQDVQLSLAVIAQPEDRLTVAGQLFFFLRGEEREATLDWAFAEWRFLDQLRLRAGLAKMPLGLSGELLDVGTLRPMFYLPQGIYGPAGIFSEAYQGVGLTGRFELRGEAGLEYDLLAGHLELERRSPFGALDPSIPEEQLVRARALVARVAALPFDGVRVAFSGYLGRALPAAEEAEVALPVGEAGGDAPRTLLVFGLSAEYAPGPVGIRAEYFRRQAGDEETDDAAYLEAAWFVIPRLQLVARAELSLSHLEGIDQGSALLRHRELAFGVDWWFSPDFVLKLSYHELSGNRFAFPEDFAEAHGAGELDPHTRLVLLGTQFSF